MDFSTRKNGDHAALVLEFYNDPLHGFPWNVFNIKREGFEEFFVGSASVIAETGYRVDLDPAVHDRNGQGHGNALPLPASIHPLLWIVLLFDDVGPCVVNERGISCYLDPGTHELAFLMHADDVDVRVVTHKFVAGADAATCNWVGKPERLRSGLRKILWRKLLRLLGRSPATVDG